MVRLLKFSLLLVLAGGNAASQELSPVHRQALKEYAQISLGCSTYAEAMRAREFIQGEGGQVALIVSPKIMFGWIPPSKVSVMVGRYRIKSIQYKPDEYIGDSSSKVSNYAAGYFRSLFQEEDAGLNKIAQQNLLDSNWCMTKEPSKLSQQEYLKDLQRAGLDLEKLEREGKLMKIGKTGSLQGNSDYMIGTVTVAVFFLESNGAIDSNLYDWKPEAESLYYKVILDDLAFWSRKAQHYGKSLTFNIVPFFSTDSACQTPYEQALRPANFLVSVDIKKLGFGSEEAYCTFLRSKYATDWAYVANIVLDPSSRSSFLGLGTFGGPWIWVKHRVDRGFPGVFAHETGHIFWALDEYFQTANGYNGNQGMAKVPNGNSVGINPASVHCVMRYIDMFELCSWTPVHVGWTNKIYLTRVVTNPGGLEVLFSDGYRGNGPYRSPVEFGWSVGTPITLWIKINQSLDGKSYVLDAANVVGPVNHPLNLVVTDDSTYIVNFKGPAQPPQFVYPANASVNVPNEVTLQWNLAGIGARYWLQVAKDSTFARIVVSDSSIAGTSYRLGSLEANTTYYWRLRAQNSFGASSWTSPSVFSTALFKVNNWARSGLNGKAILSLATTKSGVLLAGTYANGVFRSMDGGNTWTSTSLSKGYVKSIVVSLTNRIFAGAYGGGVHISDDDGQTWGEANVGLRHTRVSSVACDSRGNVFAGTYGGVYKSTDNGQSWISSINQYGIVTVISGRADVLLAGMRNTVHRMEGGTWSLGPSDAFLTSGLNDLAVSPMGRIIAATHGKGVYVSTDNGRSWLQSSTALIDTIICSLTTAENGFLYAGSLQGNIFRSNDDGDSWHQINAAYPMGQVLSILAPPSGDLLVGTVDGLYRSSQTIVSVPSVASYVLQDYSLQQNYPNPFNPSTAIRFYLPREERVSLKLFSLLGKEIKTLTGGTLPAGQHEVRFDASQYASGVYFYRLQAGSYISTKKMILLQ